ncbi:MAG: transposase, partial [Chloroflexota bacterium]|nr:transposase [Chloroflexota bacterium]
CSDQSSPPAASASAWTDDAPVRLVEQAMPRDDRGPKALACYGLLVRQPGMPEAVWLRFVAGRPVGTLTEQFLGWCGDRLAAAGVTTLVLVWDNAAWHASRAVRQWIRGHNRRVHREGGVRLVPCFLPTKSPWLNPIEPKWVHGKRRVAEPARLLTAAELEDRVCAAFACPRADHLAIPQAVA